jgi:hypothetical protein
VWDVVVIIALLAKALPTEERTFYVIIPGRSPLDHSRRSTLGTKDATLPNHEQRSRALGVDSCVSREGVFGNRRERSSYRLKRCENVRFLPAISGRLICAHSLIPHSAKTYEFSARGASGEKRMSFPFLSRHLSVV